MRVVDDLICNPSAFEPNGLEVNLSDEGLEVWEGGFDESDVEVTTTRTETGLVVTDRQAKEREPVFTMRVRDEGETNLATAAHKLQSVVGYWQRRGGWIQRNFVLGPNFAGDLACRVHKASLDGLGNWKLGNPDPVTLKLLTDGVWLATVEVTSAEVTESEQRELIFALAEILGTTPGHIRVRVKNLGTQDWCGLIFAAESRDGPADPETADSTAALAYAAADLTPKGGSEVKEVSGEKVIEHASLTVGWLTILNSEHLTHGHLTHAGIRRLWLRAEDLGEAAGDVELRVRYRSLGSLAWTTNSIVPSPLVDDWQWLDMGECRLDAAVLGDERWEFEVQARAPGGSGKVRLHRVAPLPTEQYVVGRAPDVSQGADAQSQKSPGTVESDASGGEVAWTNPSNAKATDDTRASVGLDASDQQKATSEYQLAKNFGFELPEGAEITGILVGIERRNGQSGQANVIDRRVRLVKGGVVQDPESIQGEQLGPHDKASPDAWPGGDAYKFYGGSDDLWTDGLVEWTRAEIIAAGFGVALSAKASSGAPTAEVDHILIVVYWTEGSSNTVCSQGRSIELRSDGIYRQDATEDIWGKVVGFGSNPTAPPSGLEERPYRAILIPSAGDLDTLADSGDNPLSAQAHVRPGYGMAREAAS